MKKKLFSMLLALGMIAGTFPVTAFAADSADEVQIAAGNGVSLTLNSLNPYLVDDLDEETDPETGEIIDDGISFAAAAAADDDSYYAKFEAGVLYLKGAFIDEYFEYEPGNTAAIYAEGDLTIEFSGSENQIENTSAHNEAEPHSGTGVFVDGTLTLQSDADTEDAYDNLTIQGPNCHSDEGTILESFGIQADALIVKNCTRYDNNESIGDNISILAGFAQNNSIGILVSGGVTVSDASVFSSGGSVAEGDSIGIDAGKRIDITNGDLNGYANNASENSIGVYARKGIHILDGNADGSSSCSEEGVDAVKGNSIGIYAEADISVSSTNPVDPDNPDNFDADLSGHTTISENGDSIAILIEGGSLTASGNTMINCLTGKLDDIAAENGDAKGVCATGDISVTEGARMFSRTFAGNRCIGVESTNGSITFSGENTYIVIAAYESFDGDCIGISAKNDIRILDGANVSGQALSAENGNCCGIYSEGTIKINNAHAANGRALRGDLNYALYAEGEIDVDDNLKDVNDAKLTEDKSYFVKDDVPATNVFLIPSDEERALSIDRDTETFEDLALGYTNPPSLTFEITNNALIEGDYSTYIGIDDLQYNSEIWEVTTDYSLIDEGVIKVTVTPVLGLSAGNYEDEAISLFFSNNESIHLSVSLAIIDSNNENPDIDTDADEPNEKKNGSSPRIPSYRIIIEDSTGGDVEANRSKARKGTDVILTVLPNDGYALEELIVIDYHDNVIAFEDLGDGTYSFEMPKTNVKVQGVFALLEIEQPEEEAAGFILLTIDERTAYVFGKPVVIDAPPILRNDRTLLPARFILEAIGAEVQWDEAQQMVLVTHGETVIVLYIGQETAYVNGAPVSLDSPALIENDRTYLPLRFIMEHSGAEVLWLDAQRQVMITPAAAE